MSVAPPPASPTPRPLEQIERLYVAALEDRSLGLDEAHAGAAQLLKQIPTDGVEWRRADGLVGMLRVLAETGAEQRKLEARCEPLRKLGELYDAIRENAAETPETALPRALELLAQIPEGLTPERLRAQGLVRALNEMVEAGSALAQAETSDQRIRALLDRVDLTTEQQLAQVSAVADSLPNGSDKARRAAEHVHSVQLAVDAQRALAQRRDRPEQA